MREQRVRIVDYEAFVALLERLLKRSGSRKRTCKMIGITQGQLSRWLTTRKARYVMNPTYRRLRHLVDEQGLRLLDRAFLSPEAASLLQAHKAWLTEKLGVFDDGLMGGKSANHAPSHRTGAPALTVPAAEAMALLDSICASSKDLRDQILDFETELVSRGYGQPRLYQMLRHHTSRPLAPPRSRRRPPLGPMSSRSRQAPASYQPSAFFITLDRRGLLAMLRIVEPLVAGSASPLERSLADLRASGQLDRFVKLSIAREMILLDRPPDLQRAQHLGR